MAGQGTGFEIYPCRISNMASYSAALWQMVARVSAYVAAETWVVVTMITLLYISTRTSRIVAHGQPSGAIDVELKRSSLSFLRMPTDSTMLQDPRTLLPLHDTFFPALCALSRFA